MQQLRAGIIGVGGYGAKVLAELAGNENFQVLAVADQDRKLADELAQDYHAQPYDDYRSLIVEEKLDVLFLALPTFLCGECLQLAAKQKIHVFKEAPLARTLPEAIAWARLMEKSGCRFHIGAQKRFAPGYLAAHQLLQGNRLGMIYLVRAEAFMNYPGPLGWRGDPVLAGGGVLLEMAYHLIDQIVWDIGKPERIYSLNTNRCSKRALPPYKTEDTVVLTMKFPDGAMGNIQSSWMTGPQNEKIIIHGTEASLEVDINQLRIFDPAGNLVSEEKFSVDESWLIGQEVRQFGRSLLDVEVKPFSTAREHLANVAIIESAYLSARTQLPETLKVYGSLFDI